MLALSTSTCPMAEPPPELVIHPFSWLAGDPDGSRVHPAIISDPTAMTDASTSGAVVRRIETFRAGAVATLAGTDGASTAVGVAAPTRPGYPSNRAAMRGRADAGTGRTVLLRRVPRWPRTRTGARRGNAGSLDWTGAP